MGGQGKAGQGRAHGKAGQGRASACHRCAVSQPAAVSPMLSTAHTLLCACLCFGIGPTSSPASPICPCRPPIPFNLPAAGIMGLHLPSTLNSPVQPGSYMMPSGMHHLQSYQGQQGQMPGMLGGGGGGGGGSGSGPAGQQQRGGGGGVQFVYHLNNAQVGGGVLYQGSACACAVLRV